MENARTCATRTQDEAYGTLLGLAKPAYCSLAHCTAKMSERYSFSLTTFSPSGKLVQIEYALHAVQSGATSIGIKG